MRDKPMEPIGGRSSTAPADPGPGADAMGPGLGPQDAAHSSAETHQLMIAGLPHLSEAVSRLVDSLATIVDEPLTGDLGVAAVLADDLVALARATQVLAVETARRAHAAHVHDVTSTGVRSTLATVGWNPTRATSALRLGMFLARFPDAAAAIRAGCLSIEAALAVERATRVLACEQRDQVVNWVLSWAPNLDATGVKVAVAAAVDHLRPGTAEETERRAHEDRALCFTRFQGKVLFEGQLPALEGEAFFQAVTAYAERLRAEGDRLTSAQRAADGLTGLVAEAIAGGRLPSHHGSPAAVSVLIPLAEADRVAHSDERVPGALPDLTGGIGVTDTTQLLTSGIIAGRHTLGDAAARMLLCTADLAGALVNTASPVGGMLGATRLEPLALGRSRRFASTAQRRALTIRDRGCVIPGCDVTADTCQVHHVTEWAHGGNTDLEELALVCWVHHRQVELNRWTLSRTRDASGPFWSVRRTPRPSWRRRM